MPLLPEIQDGLSRFEDVFWEPNDLPPKRLIDHRITLEPGARPVNVHPYRYPQYKNGEIERLISELLRQGLVRPSIRSLLFSGLAR